MAITDIISQLDRDEGTVLYAYPDDDGYWTIGTGHCIDKRRGCGITLTQSNSILNDDVTNVVANLNANLHWFSKLDVARQGVLINVGFNVGIHGLLAFHNTLSCMQLSDWEGAASNLLQSAAAKELPARYGRLATQLITGTWQ
jgi:lysozyme